MKRRPEDRKKWIAGYEGRHIVRGYKKHFRVDLRTAVRELTEVGALDEAAGQRLLQEEEKRIARVRRKREEKKAAMWAEIHRDQDERFYFIAGYTSGGAPYGVTWEEMGLAPGEDTE